MSRSHTMVLWVSADTTEVEKEKELFTLFMTKDARTGWTCRRQLIPDLPAFIAWLDNPRSKSSTLWSQSPLQLVNLKLRIKKRLSQSHTA